MTLSALGSNRFRDVPFETGISTFRKSLKCHAKQGQQRCLIQINEISAVFEFAFN
jgi:hypothetical protein